MRDLPRQLSADELAELFEGRTKLVERLALVEDPLQHARTVASELSDDEKKEVLDAHPAIGATSTSERSRREQGTDDDPAVLAELATLNGEYEARFGFRFVVFVDRRPRTEILEVLRERMTCSREEELDTGCRELVAIARDSWTRT